MIVLDTNVLVSGLLNGLGNPGKIVALVCTGHLQLAYSAGILEEYQEVLYRPEFPFERYEVRSLLEKIEELGYSTKGTPLAIRLPDPDDEEFLEVAISSRAQFLVSGNTKDFPPRLRCGVEVLTPSQFIAQWRDRV